MADNEPFANPMAPVSHHEPKPQVGEEARQQLLTNADFRKLMMTPRPGASTSTRRSVPQSVRGQRDGRRPVLPQEEKEKQKKKSIYHKVHRSEDDTLSELAQRYRDRAKERREGANPDYQGEDAAVSITDSYRSVAPDSKSSDAAEKRKQMILESKYLGGDMAHTHLVKGLDYALLHKVKAEIDSTDDPKVEPEDSEEVGVEATEKNEEESDLYTVRSKMALNIVQLLNQKVPERNHLFLPSRMAYVVNLEDDGAEDIPTTVIRSKADCPHLESVSALSTNDIVINKLTQILSYLRHGGKKRKNRDKTSTFIPPEIKKETISDPTANLSIYDDIDDYKPDFDRRSSKSRKERPNSYFDEKVKHESSGAQIKKKESILTSSSAEEKKIRARLEAECDGYAECYPGAIENEDAVIDSDDEADYSKMDMMRKGGVGRWDFDSNEEYSDFMGKKEALPKAAFQYGLKMSDGRKTRGKGLGKKDDKAKLEREYQQITAILAKRSDLKGHAASDQPQASSSSKKPKLAK